MQAVGINPPVKKRTLFFKAGKVQDIQNIVEDMHINIFSYIQYFNGSVKESILQVRKRMWYIFIYTATE